MKFRALFTRERLEQAALLLLPPLTSFYLMQFILGAGQQPVHRRGLFSAVGGHGLPGGVLSASPYPVRGVGSGQLLCRPVPGDAGAPLGSDRPGDGGGGVGELLLLPHRPHAGRDRPGGPSGLAPAAQIPGGPLSHRPAHRPPPLSPTCGISWGPIRRAARWPPFCATRSSWRWRSRRICPPSG